jgi:hypothetical protein
LAGQIDFQALRNIPIAFAPYGRREGSFHNHNSFTLALACSPQILCRFFAPLIPVQHVHNPDLLKLGRR